MPAGAPRGGLHRVHQGSPVTLTPRGAVDEDLRHLRPMARVGELRETELRGPDRPALDTEKQDEHPSRRNISRERPPPALGVDRGERRKEPDRRTGVHGVDEQLRELGYRRAEALGGQDLDRAFWGRTENLADSSSAVASATDEFSADPGLCC